MKSQWILSGALVFVLAGALAAPAPADQPTDAWVTTKIKMSLLTDDLVDGLDVNVDTFDGHVTLHGKVGSEAEKTRAVERARQVNGVREVRNLLVVVPDPARKATRVADAELKKQVSTVLERDMALQGSEITVKSVNDGMVLLSGDARTLSAHRRALEDARSVDGVRRVASEIRSPDELADEEIWHEGAAAGAISSASDAMADVWITTKAKVFLIAEPGLSPLSVNVDTYRGVVTLFGIVGSEDARTRAGAEVSKIEGVKAVQNQLQVVPDVAAGTVAAKDEEVMAAVSKRLEGSEALSDADIDVDVKNGVVRLTGTVPTQRDRITALTIARNTGGVYTVIDDLTLSYPKSS